MPWYILKQNIFNAELYLQDNLTGEHKWYWIWWAYGKTDTRYLKHNDMTIAITAWDGIWAISELIVIYLFWYRQYGIFTAWYGLLIGICQEYGQFIWYFPVIYNNFSDLKGSLLNKILKFGIMSIPWIIYTPITIIGFIWFLVDHYKQMGINEHLNKKQKSNGNSLSQFVKDVGIFTVIDSEDNEILTDNFGKDKCSKYMMWFIFIFPWIYFIVDVIIWYSNNFWSK